PHDRRHSRDVSSLRGQCSPAFAERLDGQVDVSKDFEKLLLKAYPRREHALPPLSIRLPAQQADSPIGANLRGPESQRCRGTGPATARIRTPQLWAPGR